MDSVSTTYGYIEASDNKTLINALALPAVPQKPPEWVKDDVSLYTQMNWSPERFIETLEQIVDQTSGEGAFTETLGSIQLANGKTTVGELLEKIDGPVHVSAEVPQNASELLRQKAIFGFEVSDPDLIRELFFADDETVQNLENARIKRLPVDVAAILPELGQLPDLEFGIALTEDAILFSPNADYLADTFGSAGNSKRPLSESPEYQQIAAKFPENTSVITYQRQDGRLEGLYEQLRSGMLGQGEIPSLAGGLLNFDFTTLPPFPEMSKYLQTTGGYIVPEQDGFRSVTFSLPPREQ